MSIGNSSVIVHLRLEIEIKSESVSKETTS
jgi:hypothetical protein